MLTHRIVSYLSVFFIFLVLLPFSAAICAVDVNNDLKTGIAEAAHAMEVAASLRSGTPPSGDVNGD